MEVQSRLKGAVSAAKTRSKLRAELALAREEHTKALQAWREVEALHPPAPVLLEEVPDEHGRGVRQVWSMGDANVWTTPGSREGFNSERRQALLNSWRERRYKERGFVHSPYIYDRRVKDLAERLSKIERKLGALMF